MLYLCVSHWAGSMLYYPLSHLIWILFYFLALCLSFSLYLSSYSIVTADRCTCTSSLNLLCTLHSHLPLSHSISISPSFPLSLIDLTHSTNPFTSLDLGSWSLILVFLGPGKSVSPSVLHRKAMEGTNGVSSAQNVSPSTGTYTHTYCTSTHAQHLLPVHWMCGINISTVA